MGNSIIRLASPSKSFWSIPCASRRDCYDADAKDEVRHSNAGTGFTIEETHRHCALVHTGTFRKACFMRTSSSEKTDLLCDIKFCTSSQDVLDSLLASDDQCKTVAAIAAVISSFATEASVEDVKGCVLHCCQVKDIELLHTLQNWICKGLFQPIGQDSHSTSVRLSATGLVRSVILSIDQTQILQIVSALQNARPQFSAVNSLAWPAYVHAITAEVLGNDDESQSNPAAFTIVQFLEQCLMNDYVGLCEAKTLDAVARMLTTQITTQTERLHSKKHIHLCALFAACSLKRQNVTEATFFADEASRLIKMSWHSLLLKRTVAIEPNEVADFVVVCQCALLNTDYVTAHGMSTKIIAAGNMQSYFCHSILHHGHVLKALTNLLHGTVRSSSFHLECAVAFGAYDSLDAPTFVPEIRCLQQVDSHYDLAVATFHFLTGMWCKSSTHLQKQRSNDVIADSMGMVLHMFALQKVPKRIMLISPTSELQSRAAFFDDEKEEYLSLESLKEIGTEIRYDALEELWNQSMQNATIDDAVSARLVATSKLSAALQVPCVHSQLCFAFSLRLLFDKKATEALDVCENWLEDLNKTGQFHPGESFVWYRLGLSACKALACAILSQGVKVCELLKMAQNELESYDLPGLRAYISFIGLLAAGALCARRHNAINDSNAAATCIWTNPNIWKQSAVAHILRRRSFLEPVVSTQATKNNSTRKTLHKRRLSNVFEDHEVCDRDSYLKDSELTLLIMNQYTSLVAGLTRMRPISSAELTESKCVFAQFWEHMHSWKLELAHVIASESGQMQPLSDARHTASCAEHHPEKQDSAAKFAAEFDCL